MRSHFLFAPLIFFIAAFGFTESSMAANLTVMPTSLRIAPPKAADVIIVRNGGRSPVKMQIRIFRWEQKGDKDVYYPTRDVIASPPFITIKGGADGDIRVARIAQTPVSGIETYRLIIDELPSSRVRTKIVGQAASVEVVTRQILPVFFTGTIDQNKDSAQGAVNAVKLSFSVKEAKGGYYITATNKSATVVRVGDIVLLAGGQEVTRSRHEIGNILPKSSIKFFVAGKGGGKPQQIRVLDSKGVKGVYSLR